jgi:steroid delta-isomerase-like uncharacterized protein
MTLEPEQMKLLAKRFYEEVLNHGDLSAIDDLVSDDFVEHEELAGIPANREGLREWVLLMRTAFPDLTVSINQMIASGDEIWVHMTMAGTQDGPFLHIPPSGRKVRISAFDRVRVRDGKASEHWGVTDNLTLLQQLGELPG